MSTSQGRHGQFESDKAHSIVVGIICPPGWDRVNCNPNLGKARALEALVAVVPLSSMDWMNILRPHKLVFFTAAVRV